MNNSQAKWMTVVSAIFISGLIFLFLPSEIYLRNPLEFISTPAQLLRNLLLGGLLLTAGLALPVFVPQAGWQKAYAILIGGAALALWISSVFLVADFGELDGTSFDLARHSAILTDQSVWFTVVLLAACIGMWKWPQLVMRSIAEDDDAAGVGLLDAVRDRVQQRAILLLTFPQSPLGPRPIRNLPLQLLVGN